jgi:tetratricopeptide (TPR) repeat protein
LGDINRLLGKYQDAVNEYQLAITELESLVHQHPDNPEYRQAEAYSYNWLGETLRIWLEEAQKPVPYTRADAENEYANALRLQQELVHQIPTNPSYQQELARTYYNRGILRYSNRDHNDSESDFRQAVGLLEPLGEKNIDASAGNNNPPPLQDLARVYNNLANLLGHEKRMPEAAQLYERAIAIHEGLCKKEPGNREYKMELAQFYDNMAILLLNENQMEPAKQRNQQALTLFEELATPASSSSLARERDKARDVGERLKAGGQKKR